MSQPEGEVAAAFAAFPEPARATLLEVRRLIFATAAALPEVGPLTEALRWGEPAYLTLASGSGSTLRLGVIAGGGPAVLVNCRTSLVASFREHFADALAFEGARAIRLDPATPLPEAALGQCLALALTYHRRRRIRA